tara:strand:+ start:1764 stop:2345 length:582 start_codon:yes stop_codon:yes gene_type:complete
MKKIKDHYYFKAKSEGYVARSIYKLEEIDKKHNLISKGNFVIDFGCSPGSWLQYSSRKVGKKGFVLGIDLKPVNISLPDNVKILEMDIFEAYVEDLKINGKLFDVILSDMSPKTTGIRSADSQRSLDLNQRVIEISRELLKPNGSILLKVFQGASLEKFQKDLRRLFSNVKLFKPKSSRSESVEIFLLCRVKF